jgi:hypothetical protein
MPLSVVSGSSASIKVAGSNSQGQVDFAVPGESEQDRDIRRAPFQSDRTVLYF